MSAEKVRLGIIGVGGMGSGHCESAKKVDEMELTAVADVDEDRAKEIGEQYGARHFDNSGDLLDSGMVDAVLIATPHYSHPPLAIDAFERGIHVLSEKPLGAEVGNVDRMLAAAERSGKVFGVMFQVRTSPEVCKARQVLESGELGEIMRTMLLLPAFRSQAYYDSGTWRATWAGEGGGVLTNQAPHSLDVLTLLGGVPRRVLGRTATLGHDIEVEDCAEALLEYENGARGYIYASTCEPGAGSGVEIVGDKGKLQLREGGFALQKFDPPAKEYSVTTDSMWGSPRIEHVEVELPETEAGHHVIMRNFARAILYGEELIAPGADGMKSLEVANAIYLSSYGGGWVDIPVDREAFHELMESLRKTSSFTGEMKSRRETDPHAQSRR